MGSIGLPDGFQQLMRIVGGSAAYHGNLVCGTD